MGADSINDEDGSTSWKEPCSVGACTKICVNATTTSGLGGSFTSCRGVRSSAVVGRSDEATGEINGNRTTTLGAAGGGKTGEMLMIGWND